MDQLRAYCHGYVATPVIEACERRGLFRLLDSREFQRRELLIAELRASPGHFTLALQALESLGWLERNSDDAYRMTAQGGQEVFNWGLTTLYSRGEPMSPRHVAYAQVLDEKIAEIGFEMTPGALMPTRLARGSVVVAAALYAKELCGGEAVAERVADLHMSCRLVKLLKWHRWLADDEKSLTAAGEALLRSAQLRVADSWARTLYNTEDRLFGRPRRTFERPWRKGSGGDGGCPDGSRVGRAGSAGIRPGFQARSHSSLPRAPDIYRRAGFV